jgi:O-antigen/teichoic acid export membrane protein
MQLSLLVVNLILITVISREYGPTIYGEYASSKSLGVLIGTAVVMSLALVATKLRAQNDIEANYVFSNSYYLVTRNLLIGLFLLYPATLLFKRDFSMTGLFLVGFVFNELIHISLAYYQANGDFVSSSKQIMLRTLIYGVGAVTIVFSGYSILWVIFYQVVTLAVFFGIAHFSIPSSELNNTSPDVVLTRNKLTKSGQKMVLTTFSSALISELDIVLLGLFFGGPLLGVLSWARRILEILFQLAAASLDILFPELSKTKTKTEVMEIRNKLRRIVMLSFIIPVIFFPLKGTAGNIFVFLLGEEFSAVGDYTAYILFCLPLMVWSRINIIFSRALNFEVPISKIIFYSSFISFLIYLVTNQFLSNSAVVSIILSQLTISALTSYSFRKSFK